MDFPISEQINFVCGCTHAHEQRFLGPGLFVFFFPFSAYSYKRGSLTRLGLSWEPASPRGVDLSLAVQGTLGLQVHLAFYVGAEDARAH